MGPAGTLFLIEVVTDNRNRTDPELRKIFDKHNGQLGSAGSAAWAFDDKGVITVEKERATEEKLFEVAVGAGADDVEDIGESWMVTTAKTELEAVRSALVDAEHRRRDRRAGQAAQEQEGRRRPRRRGADEPGRGARRSRRRAEGLQRLRALGRRAGQRCRRA